MVATIGAFTIAASMLPFLWNMFTALRRPADAPDDPWDANTLEWATSSPPPPYNFERLPEVRSERPLFDLKHPELRKPATAAAIVVSPGSGH